MSAVRAIRQHVEQRLYELAPDRGLIALIYYATCSLVGLTALLVMVGWLLHAEQLIRIFPSFAPMQFNTAVGLLLCSVGLVCQAHDKLLSAAAGIATVLIAAAVLSEYALGDINGIDTFFIQPFSSANVSTLGRMAPNTAFALLFGGAAVVLLALLRRKQYYGMLLVTILGSFVVALGTIPLIGKLAGVEVSNIVWSGYGHTAAHSAICFILLGFCVILNIYRDNKNLLAWLPFPTCLSFIIVAVSLSTAVHIQENVKFEAALQSEADNIAHKAQLQMEDLYHALDSMANRWEIGGGTAQYLWEGDANAYLKSFPYLLALSKTDPETRVAWLVPDTVSRKAIGYQLSSEVARADAIKKALATNSSQTTHVLTLLTGDQGFLYLTPLHHDGIFDGLQVGSFKLSNLFNLILDAKELQNVFVTIQDENGQQIFSNLPAEAPHSRQWQKSAQLQNMDYRWTLTVSPTPLFMESKNSFVSLAVLIVGLLTAFLISLCSFLILKRSAQNKTLSEVMSDLAVAEELQQKIINSSGYMIISASPNGTISTFNMTAEKLLGYKAEELVGKQSPALLHKNEEIIQRASELTAKLGRTVDPSFEVFVTLPVLEGQEEHEWTYVRKDGTTFPISLIVTVLRDEANRVSGFLGIARDITLLKQADCEREQLMAKLTESNTELGRFAYVASHDMQEPLRMIANFSALIKDEYKDKLDTEGQEYLQIVMQSAHRMQAMINDLLEYARVGNDVSRFVLIDPNEELGHVLENLSSTIAERKAVITHDHLPNIVGNPVQFMRLMQNLVANALKYQKDTAFPLVHVRAEEQEDFWCFSVQDNGIGMEERYIKQIFEPFRRLHSWQEFAGTGIGLAVARKIVENLGGKIWATSEVDVGSVFHFTVLKRSAEV